MIRIKECGAQKLRTLRLGLAALSLLYLALAQPLAAQVKYTVTDLGTLGGTFNFPWAVTLLRRVAGASTLAGDTAVHAYLWKKGVLTDLGTLGGPNSFALYMNVRTHVVGGSDTDTGVSNAFLWRKGVMTNIGTLGGNNSAAWGVSSRDQVAGWAETPDVDPNSPYGSLQFHAYRWEDGAMTDLGTLGGYNSVAFHLNLSGQVVGSAETTTSVDPALGFPPFHAFLLKNGALTDLGTLEGAKLSEARGVNKWGHAVGVLTLPGDVLFHPALWKDSTITDLGTVAGDIAGVAWGINNKGQVVGGTGDLSFPFHAFIWENGVMTDLNTLIPADSGLQLLQAFDIDIRGDIVGFAVQLSTGEIRGFLLKPVRGSITSASTAATTYATTTARPRVTLPQELHDSIGWGTPGLQRLRNQMMRRNRPSGLGGER